MKKIEIAPRTIIFTTFFLIGLYLLWILHDLLFSLFIGFILMSALRPMVSFLHKRRVPRAASVLLVYLSFVILLGYLFYIILPPIIIETTNLLRSLPGIMQKLNPTLSSYIKFDQLTQFTQYIPTATNEALKFISSIFSNALFVVTTFFFGFYFLLDETIIKRVISSLLDEEKGQIVASILDKSERRMSSWFWGEITLMTAVGALTFIGLSLIGNKYVLPLAVLAGMLEVVPNIGPTLSAIPAVLIGFSQSPVLGISTIALYFIVQQLENNLIVPIIMKRAVGISPIITLISLIIGGRIGGVFGILLAIPLYLFLETIYLELRNTKAFAEKKPE
ncbi:AI-2E family transporter [Candidatus Roizmanbacteria bacterium]|nr:AI-2E family transporter [Candidatus Roizmanbacteria bacterium]